MLVVSLHRFDARIKFFLFIEQVQLFLLLPSSADIDVIQSLYSSANIPSSPFSTANILSKTLSLSLYNCPINTRNVSTYHRKFLSVALFLLLSYTQSRSLILKLLHKHKK